MREESLLAHRAFMHLWFARLAGTAGSQMLLVGVGWQLYDLTGSAWDLGLAGLLQFVPALVLALPAGHLIDRWHRARIVAASLGVQLAVCALLWAASQGGWTSRELLLGTSVVLGAARAFQMPAQQALIPSLVPAAMLPRALAFSSAGIQGAIIAGPALGGFIYIASAAATYASCAALFAAAAILALLVRYTPTPRQAEPASWATLLAGVRFVRQHPVVMGAISLDLFAVLLGGATALLPVYAKDILHTGPWGLGLLRAAPAVGALIMSLALARWPVRRRSGRALLAAVAVFGAAMGVFGWSTTLLLSLLALAVSGAADMISVVIRSSLVQLETPDDMRGRVSAVNALFIGASNQLGEFRAGATAAALGAVGTVMLGAFGTVVVAGLWWRLFPALAQRDALVAGR
jgi:MFS family permease